MSPAFAFVTHVRAKPGKRDELIAANLRMQEVTADEDGVPIYVFHTSIESPDDFWYYDYYESQEASDAHNSTADFREVMGRIGDLAEVIEVVKLEPFGRVKSGPVRSS